MDISLFMPFKQTFCLKFLFILLDRNFFLTEFIEDVFADACST